VASDVTEIKPRMVPLREGMFRMPDRLDMPAALLGDRCRNCGVSFFPPRFFARCQPERWKRRIARRAKSTRFTIVGSSRPISDGSALRLERFEDGAQPLQRDGNRRHRLRAIGQQVATSARAALEDESGNNVVSLWHDHRLERHHEGDLDAEVVCSVQDSTVTAASPTRACRNGARGDQECLEDSGVPFPDIAVA